MNIILGASGQIGSLIIEELRKHGQPVRGVIRSEEKAKSLSGVQVVVADFFDLNTLKNAFKGGDTTFLLTPENPESKDIIADTRIILSNYREVLRYSGIKKIIGLSSIGAHIDSGTGNMIMSYMLEHAFENLSIEQAFIRPAYYYSNWLGYIETAREFGILPTFFPVDLKIPMIAPPDVAEFAANLIMEPKTGDKIYEITGPELYSSSEIAHIFGMVLGRKVEAQQIPQENWKSTLLQVGFSDNAAQNLIEMTSAVIDGKTRLEDKDKVIRLKTGFEKYLSKMIMS